jgi:hypothetical protein
MEAHENLLSEWRDLEHHVGKGFILDGIIDPIRWSAASRRVLLLLKEAYDEPGVTEGYDLRTVIRDRWKGPKYNIWWKAAYWCFGAHANDGFPEMPADDAAYSGASEALLSSAIANVKKSNGRSESSDEEIAQYARRDGDYLKRQVELIDPGIVICGNTWAAVRHLWPAARKVIDLVWENDGTLIVDFWHPANQFPNKLNYYSLGFLLHRAGAYKT